MGYEYRVFYTDDDGRRHAYGGKPTFSEAIVLMNALYKQGKRTIIIEWHPVYPGAEDES